MHQPIYSPNKKHLKNADIQMSWEVLIPSQTVCIYSNCTLTPTNHLFVGCTYIPTGLYKGHDNKKLSIIERNYMYFKNAYSRSKKHLDGVYIWCFDEWSGNYYHWLCETMPRILFALQNNPNATILLPNQLAKLAFVKDSICCFDSKVLFIDEQITHHIEKIITIQTSPRWGIVDPEHQKAVVNIIKDHFNIVDNNAFRKVFISRAKARYRRIVNEGAVIDLVQRHGYEIVYTEELSFAQQVRLFSEAKSIIGLHGAGYANIIFMPAHGRMMEFRNQEIQTQPLCYFHLANIFKVTWDYFISDSVGIVDNFNDVTIDMLLFEDVLHNFEKE